jgi:hypothetical protein
MAVAVGASMHGAGAGAADGLGATRSLAVAPTYTIYTLALANKTQLDTTSC